MDNQTIAKLNMMLQGIVYRLTEEKDYFESLEGSFKSGVVQFPFSCLLDGDELIISFEGRKIKAMPQELPDIISKFSAPYHEIILNCKMRGELLIIEAGNKKVTMKTETLKEEKKSIIQGHSDAGIVSNHNYLIKPGKADNVLKAIGIIADNGKIKNQMIRKYNQIDHFVELLEPMLKELIKDRKELNIVDCACGKSYLSFVLNYYLRDVLKINCRILGIDIFDDVIESSRQIAQSLGYRNMTFKRGNIRALSFEDDKGEQLQPDLIISLHACDTATDYALAYGIRNKARGIVAVPCCHSELLNQYSYEPFADIIKHGVFKARLADVLTDGLRCMVLDAFGYDVSVVEYVSPLDTPKNLLIRGILRRGFNNSAYKECLEMAQKLNSEPMLIKETIELSKS